MTSCKECGAPLDGPLSFLARLLGVKRSDKVPEYCNKCEEGALVRRRVGSLQKRAPSKKKKKR